MDDSYSNDAPVPSTRKPRRAKPMTAFGLFVAAMILFVATVSCFLLAVSVRNVGMEGGDVLMALGLGIGSMLGFFTLFVLLVSAFRWATYGSARPPMYDEAAAHRELMHALNTVADRLLISDGAKRIAYREQDRNALREAIREDIRKGDFEAAMVLANEMGNNYGYREEAEQFRDIVLAARDADTQQKVTEAVAALDNMLEAHEWHRALQEVSKIQRLYPDAPRVQGLDKYVNEAFEQYKRDLERQFLEAAQRDEIELAMDLLKELDKYLTEAAAAPLRETARGVIGKKRDNLGVQFKMAVQDHEWPLALRVGEQIVREFPNTKMAAEVRGMMQHLQDLASREPQHA